MKIRRKELEIRKPEHWYHVLPLAIMIFLVPLIVYLKIIPLSGARYDYWNGSQHDYDFFTYYKVVWFFILAAAAFGMFFYKLYQEKWKIKRTLLYVPTALYALLVILSSVTSQYKQVAFFGFVSRYEGMFVLLGYLLVFFTAINVIDNEKHIKVLLGALFSSAVVIGLLGVFQYLGHDFFQTMGGKLLMLPRDQEHLAPTLNFQLGFRAAYATLYHTNYVGSYTAMLFPIALSMFLLLKGWSQKAIPAFMSLLMFALLVASHSRAGIVGTAAAMGVFAIILWRFFIKHWKYSIAAVLIFVVLFAGINLASEGWIKGKIATLFEDARRIITGGEQAPQAGPDDVINLALEEKRAVLSTPTYNFSVVYVDGEFQLRDQEDNIVPLDFDEATGRSVPQAAPFSTFTVQSYEHQGLPAVQLARFELVLSFAIQEGNIKLINYLGQLDEIKPVEKWGFEGQEKLGSARGYIWSRTIPLLRNTIFLGYGPDTFTIVFPQHDYLGKIIAYNNYNIIVDKPHNLFLQAALSTGIVSAVVMTLLFLSYMLWSLYIYLRRTPQDFLSIVGFGIFAAITGYIFSGFFNDSVIAVAPVFWVLFGAGVSINKLVVERNSL